MSTLTDTELKIQGVEVLIDALSEVMAEKFITPISREPFDYTEWQRNLWDDKSIEELSNLAMAHRNNTEKSS
jgi:hypothetical protein